MNKFSIMTISLLFTASAVFASPNTKVNLNILDKVDKQFLFDNSSIDIVLLNSDEMTNTDAKGWFSRISNRFRSWPWQATINGYTYTRQYDPNIGYYIYF